MPVSKYDSKMVPVHREMEQKARDTVQFYRLNYKKTGKVNGPLTMRDFWNQAAGWYVDSLRTKDNGGNPFPHCTQLPKGKFKR